MRCTIVPPHVLERVLERTDNPDMRARARRSLVIDASNRVERRLLEFARPEKAEPTSVLAEPKRTIHDAAHREHLPGKAVRAEGAPATGDAIVDQAYDWLGVTFEFFSKTYGRNSIDGAGLPMISTVHFGENYDNAFWNGEQMVYGDGDGTLFNAFTGPIDVTGHELTHGVTQFTAALEYFGQSGALNESMSDVFGALIKQYYLDHTSEQADWLIGEGLLAEGINGVALRSMKEPGTAYDDPQLGKDPQPGHMDQYVRTSRDNGGVHINSGIPNRAFYLAAVELGGYAWEKAGKIWYDTLSGGGLAPDIDFAAFAAKTVATATTLFGTGSAELTAVQNAWAGVGLST